MKLDIGPRDLKVIAAFFVHDWVPHWYRDFEEVMALFPAPPVAHILLEC